MKSAAGAHRATTTFVGNDDGSVAIMFAIALLPTMLLIGAGIDYARAVSERSTLQSGVDAAVLAGIQQIRRGDTFDNAGLTIQNVVAVNDTNPSAYVSKVAMSADGTTLCVTAASATPTSIMVIAGYKSVAVTAYACSKMQLDTYEVAFAIDNSGSMNNSAQSGGKTKMQYAQQAAQQLVQAMQPASSNSPGPLASFSVVPFTSSVNVGPNNRGASWLDMNAQSSIHWKSFSYLPPEVYQYHYSLFTAFDNLGVSWGGCVEERPGSYTTSDDAPSSANPDTLFVPFFSPDETDQNNTAKSSRNSDYNKATFNNYLPDTSGVCQAGDAYDQNDQRYGRGDGQTKLCKYTAKMQSNGNSYYVTGQAAGPNAGCVAKPLLPLDATASDVNASIGAMAANGDTALAPGFMWAWRTLSPKGPFASNGARWSTSGQQQPKPYGYVDANTTAPNHKIIILLTDGMNQWYGQDGSSYIAQYDNNKMVYNAFGYPQDGRLTNGNATATTTSNARSLLDKATLNACNAAKATVDGNKNPAPVEIYTVGFVASDGIDDAGRALLKQCATDDAHSFIAANGDALIAVFQQIAASITAPRIAK